jgi:hypothetical protein
LSAVESLATVAPVFVEMAHRIVWATAATVNGAGEPATRILHPIWEWDGETLSGRIASSPLSPKAKHLERIPAMSITYWHPDHDTCTVRCRATWDLSEAGRRDLWQRFSETPEPLGYDPSMMRGWDSPESPTFGVLQLEPIAIRLLEGSKMASGTGRLLVWRAD